MRVSPLLVVPALALGMLLASPSASAQSKDMTDSDLAMLPEACTARIRGDEATQKLWRDRIGRYNFLHLHHFCFGMYFTNKANFSLDKNAKAEHLDRATREFDYVLRHWPADSPYRPEAERRKREAETALAIVRPHGKR